MKETCPLYIPVQRISKEKPYKEALCCHGYCGKYHKGFAFYQQAYYPFCLKHFYIFKEWADGI